MSCKIEMHVGEKVVHDHTPLITCRYAGKRNIMPMLTPGVCYEAGTILVQPEAACEPVTALADIDAEKDRICGILECAVDLTEETEPCPITLTINAEVNTDRVCWPEGVTDEQVDMLRRTAKGCLCFTKLEYCTPVPPDFADRLETKEAVKAIDAPKPVRVVPAPPADSPAVDPAI